MDPATAGTLHGKIVFHGKKPAPQKISMDAEAACVKAHAGKPVYEETVVVGKDGGLANAFVYIKTGLEGKTFEPSPAPVMLDQHGCMFVPRAIGMQCRADARREEQRRRLAQHPSDAEERARMERTAIAGRRRPAAQIRAAGNHDSGEVRRALLDAGLYRRGGAPLFRGDRRGRLVRDEECSAGRLHDSGLA